MQVVKPGEEPTDFCDFDPNIQTGFSCGSEPVSTWSKQEVQRENLQWRESQVSLNPVEEP